MLDQVKTFTFYVGPVWIQFNPPYIHIGVMQHRIVKNKDNPPCIYQGMFADHLTIPLEPLPYGRNKGKFNIHLTYKKDGETLHHYTLILLDPKEIISVMESTASKVLECAQKNIRRVEPKELEKQGYFVVLLSDEQRNRMDSYVQNLPRRPKLKITENMFKLLGNEMEICDASALDDIADGPRNETVYAFRENETGQVEQVSLFYLNKGFQGEAPGWYMNPSTLEMVKPFFEIIKSAGSKINELMKVIEREIGMEATAPGSDEDFFNRINSLEQFQSFK